MSWDTLYNYKQFLDNILLDFVQYSAIFLVLPAMVAVILFTYATQDIQLKLIKSIDAVEELLRLHQIDTSKLFLGSRLKLRTKIIILSYITILLVFFCMHFVPGEDKHITVHFAPLLLAAYRGHLSISQLLFIKSRHALLNNILMKLLRESNELPNVICMSCNLFKPRLFKLDNLCLLHKLK